MPPRSVPVRWASPRSPPGSGPIRRRTSIYRVYRPGYRTFGVRGGRDHAAMRRTWRALARLFVALVAFLTARGRTEEGVTSGGMADQAKLAEAQARAGEAQARAAEAELRARGEIPDGDGAARRMPEDVGAEHPLPDGETARAILERMMLIRRFEERAGEMYAKAKIGGFLHLCIGEEATIVGAIDALAEGDYLL